MAKKKSSHFRLNVLSSRRSIYDDYVNSVFISGDQGEYELLPYHYPLVGVFNNTAIVIDWDKRIPAKTGIVRFFANECTILMEEFIEPAHS